MLGIRQMLGIESLRAKIAIRSLQRMGHLLRMPNDRLTKRVCLGWYRREGRRTGKQTTIHYWRKLVRETGLDPDNMDMHARDRNRWKNQIKIRMERIREWEEQMARSIEIMSKRWKTSLEIGRGLQLESHCDVIGSTVGGCAKQKQD